MVGDISGLITFHCMVSIAPYLIDVWYFTFDEWPCFSCQALCDLEDVMGHSLTIRRKQRETH